MQFWDFIIAKYIGQLSTILPLLVPILMERTPGVTQDGTPPLSPSRTRYLGNSTSLRINTPQYHSCNY
uniref:Rab-GAP TBC domain-containing protein n=1 Tax=Heterorhabditis bacteriophora TaxID=37862 RepID=A0A1I7WGK1_HETBA